MSLGALVLSLAGAATLAAVARFLADRITELDEAMGAAYCELRTDLDDITARIEVLELELLYEGSDDMDDDYLQGDGD